MPGHVAAPPPAHPLRPAAWAPCAAAPQSRAGSGWWGPHWRAPRAAGPHGSARRPAGRGRQSPRAPARARAAVGLRPATARKGSARRGGSGTRRPRTGLRVCDDSGRGRPSASRSGAPVFLSRCTCAGARGALANCTDRSLRRAHAAETRLAPSRARRRTSKPGPAVRSAGAPVRRAPCPRRCRGRRSRASARPPPPPHPAAPAPAAAPASLRRPRGRAPARRAAPGRVAGGTFTHASTAVHATTVASRSPVCPTMSARRARQPPSRRAARDERSAARRGAGQRARTCVGEVQADLAAVVLAGAQRLLAQVGDLAALHRRLLVERDVLVRRHLQPGAATRRPPRAPGRRRWYGGSCGAPHATSPAR